MERHFNSDSKLLEALIKIQAVLLPIQSNHPNEFTGKDYLDLPAIQVVAKPILTEHNVLMQQLVDIAINEQGTPLVTVETELSNKDGEYVRCTGTLGATEMAKANATQKLGATVSYLRRFQAMTVLGISGTDDDDESGFRPRPGDNTASPDTSQGEDFDLNGGSQLTEGEELTALRSAIRDTAQAECFSDKERLDIKAKTANARTLPLLKKLLADVQDTISTRSEG